MLHKWATVKKCRTLRFLEKPNTLKEENILWKKCPKSCETFLLILNKKSQELNVKIQKSKCRGNLKQLTAEMEEKLNFDKKPWNFLP